jgi:hypothetical protein
VSLTGGAPCTRDVIMSLYYLQSEDAVHGFWPATRNHSQVEEMHESRGVHRIRPTR